MLSTYIIIWIEKNGNKMSKALTFIDPTKESLRLVYVIVPPLTNSGSSPVYIYSMYAM